MSETEERIAKLRQRMEGWGLNEDHAWFNVKLGELRAVFGALDDTAFFKERAASRKDELLTMKYGQNSVTEKVRTAS
jgi:hypothetical protein